jgi:hypothetical protein
MHKENYSKLSKSLTWIRASFPSISSIMRITLPPYKIFVSTICCQLCIYSVALVENLFYHYRI